MTVEEITRTIAVLDNIISHNADNYPKRIIEAMQAKVELLVELLVS